MVPNMDMTLIFFIYGLAFFSMGLAITFESRRTPLLAENRVLRPLALFGLVHGMHEWLEMFVDRSAWWIIEKPEIVGWIRISLLLVSFILLSLFAWRSINPRKKYQRHELVRWALIFTVYITFVLVFAYLSGLHHPDRLKHLDAFVRLLIAVPGSSMAGLALYLQAKDAYSDHRAELGKLLYWAAASFVLYGVTQIFVPRLDVLPASIVNSENFLIWTGIPVQLIRAVLAIIILFSLVHATQKVEIERQENFLREQKARMDAVNQLEQELLDREKFRQEVLRHIVIAQEDERTRIARELHDETSQILTGFSLHLAALDEKILHIPEAHQQIMYLQGLNKQIAQSLYRLIRDLRPVQLDDMGLIAALNFLSGDFKRRLNLKVNIQVEGMAKRLDTLVETSFFRIAQEALTNVTRHAQTDEVEIILSYTDEMVSMQVIDGGIGFDVETELATSDGYGLTGMIERANAVGGKLELVSAPGKGTRIELKISNQNAFADGKKE